ncbi:MAG: hypothetical protein K2K38_04305 [Clostridia bacterium]|nr:hypothetical protein [Clostridia bacterium]
MPEQIQDEIISFEDFNQYDISYPVIITRWEIKQVHGLNKQYLQVYFQKISDNVRVFHFNVKCYSVFGEAVDEITGISIDKVDKKNIQFSEVIPLKSEIRKVEIYLQKCCLLDNSVVAPKGRQMVVNTFKPFNEEDLEAGKRLLPNAKGFPIDNVSHWYCSCGLLYSSDMQKCGKCNKSKKEIFTLLTPESIDEEKLKFNKNYAERKNKKAVLSTIVFANTLLTLILVGFYLLYQIRAADLWYSWFWGYWDTTIGVIIFNLLFILSLALSIGLFVVNFIGNRSIVKDSRTLSNNKILNKIDELFFDDKKFKKTALVTMIINMIVNIINCVYGVWFSCFYTFYLPILLNLPFTIAYIVLRKRYCKEYSEK